MNLTHVDMRPIEGLIKHYVHKDKGHFIVVSDDRLFVNVLRKMLTSQLELPHDCLTIETSSRKVLKTCKEMSVRKKKVLIFVETTMEHRRMDNTIAQLLRRIRNAKLVLLTVESDLPKLALLREKKLAESWITKPVVVNNLLAKIAVTIHPDEEIAKLLEMAEQCLENGSYRFALQACRRIFDIKPDSAVAYMIMGDAYRALDQIDEMIDAYEQAGDLEEYFFDPLERLVDYFESKNDKAGALEYLERMDAESPLNIDRKVKIGGVHVDMGNDDQAQEVFQEAVNLTVSEELGPVNPLFIQIGDEYAKRNHAEAEAYYRRALQARGDKLDASDIVTFNSLGLALRKDGRWEDAVKEYKRALKVDPKSETVYYNLALAYADGKDFDKAYQCADYATKLNREFYMEDAVVCHNLGLICSRAGQNDRARQFLEEALRINPAYEAAQHLLKSL